MSQIHVWKVSVIRLALFEYVLVLEVTQDTEGTIISVRLIDILGAE